MTRDKFGNKNRGRDVDVHGEGEATFSVSPLSLSPVAHVARPYWATRLWAPHQNGQIQ